MPSLVYDYADIASRIKGGLKQEPKLKPRPPAPNWGSLQTQMCLACHGSGVNLINGGTCNRCNGSGVSP